VLAQSTALAARLIAGSPLRHPRFRLFYVGSIASALAYTMQATIAAWLMATLTPSALMVALVQTASTAPTLLFGLIAGTLADIIERRRIVLATQIVLFAATALLAAITLAGIVGPGTLLFLTFLVGSGFTFYLPAQQASINELVARPELARAVALGAVAFNVSRAVGPALVGAIAAALSSGSALLAAALFFLPMLFASRRLKVARQQLPGVPETLVSGITSGVRYARHSIAMRALVMRNLAFAACASAFWALLPVIARDQLGLGAGGFGLLSAGFGAGAVVGALSIPRQIQHRPVNAVITMGVFLWTVSMLIIAATSYTGLALIGTFGGGFAWVSVFACLSAATQSSAPAWVRARALAVNLVSSQATLAAGSAVWGGVASGLGTHIALALSAAVLIFVSMILRNVHVRMGNEADVTMGLPVADLGIAGEPDPDDGPVLIQWEYTVVSENQEAFLRAIHAVAPARRRNGAVSWRVFRDLGDRERFVERYIVASWAEYVRSRNRMTLADRELQQRVEALQSGDAPVRISRLIGVRELDATTV